MYIYIYIYIIYIYIYIYIYMYIYIYIFQEKTINLFTATLSFTFSRFHNYCLTIVKT